MLHSAWARFGLVGLAALPLYLLLPQLGQEVLYPLGGLACVGAVVRGLVVHRPQRPAPWVLLGAGLLLWTLGDVAYTAYEVLAAEVPYPSWADALYGLGYPAMSLALLLVLRRSGVRDAVAWQDAGIWSLAAAVLAWPGLLEPTATAEGQTLLARVVAVGFPVLDLLLMLMLLRLLAGRERPAVYGLLALSLSGYLVSDAVYGVQSVAGTYVGGTVVDLGWIACYVGIGTIALHPAMVALTEPVQAPERPRSALRWFGLGAAALLAPGMLVAQDLLSDHVDVLVIASAAAMMFLLTTLRGAGLVRELEVMTRRLRAGEQELRRRASTDALTGLANRAALHERLAADAASGRRTCVALLDLDEFKHVNDSRGHEAGDALLLVVATRLVAGVREQDLVARLGGDEFAVVSSAPAPDLAARLVRCLPSTATVGGSEVPLRASIGVAEHLGGSFDGDLGSALLRDADIAMYAAKTAGGARATVYRPEMSAELLQRLEVRRQLVEAVADEQFTPWLQPVVDLASGRLLGFEALARWERPGRAPVPPGSWMPAAEESGLVVEVDAQVLRAAARQLVRWTDEVPAAATLELAVNASGRTLAEADVADRVLAVLREEGLDPRRLLLEVTEGVLIDERVADRLQQLRSAGVRIALDDFGTGWSSLTYLRRFPVDVLKLDQSFVSGIGDGPGAEAVPAAVLMLASALGLDVIAEGIETPEQAAVLRRLGCRTAQGYLLGRPAPAAELEDIVRRGTVEGARRGAVVAVRG